MSRTYRRAEVEIDCNCGAEFYQSRWNKHDYTWYIRKELAPPRTCQCGAKSDYYSRRNSKRDSKPWFKTPKEIKQMYQRIRRAKVKNAMVLGQYEMIPIFKRTNDWNWS